MWLLKRGGLWQTQLLVRHEGPGGYRDLGLAWVAETAAQTKTVRGKTMFTGKGPPDFIGVIGNVGQSVVFDAKSTLDEAWPFSLLEHHQAQDLEAAMLRGALAFLAIKTSTGTYLVMWRHLRTEWWEWYQDYTPGARARMPKLNATNDDRSAAMLPIEDKTDWLKTLVRWNVWDGR